MYPDPRINGLLYELHDEVHLSKIDLHSSYHQIYMREKDVEKRTFHYHYDHYELLVIPFGLTNAPSIFQSCMNHISNEKLHKFLLAIFDDILIIYSRTWDEHLQHLDKVLRITESQSLFTKISKYEFGMTKELYLGHIIDARGF